MNKLILTTTSEARTAELGADLALAVKPGTMIGLSGPLGSGKSVLARAMIRALAGEPDLEVPSPTFTLCQSYDLIRPVGHYDLYRIDNAEELAELGIEEFLESGIVIIEWPEIAETVQAEFQVQIRLSGNGDDRQIEIEADPDSMARLNRSLLIRGFLEENGYSQALRFPMNADASSRAYERISPASERLDLLLMNAPRQPDGPPIRDGRPYSQYVHLAEEVSAFVAIGNLLREHGFQAPEIYAQDLEAGILLIEDLGSDGILDASGEPVPERYMRAIEFLAELHRHSWPAEVVLDRQHRHIIPAYDAGAMMVEAALMHEWYLPYKRGRETETQLAQEFEAFWQQAGKLAESFEPSLVLRDYHSPNILWQAAKPGTDQIAVIDYQDALIGPSAYDVASLAQDARVDISADLEDQLTAHYIACRKSADPNFDAEAFKTGYAVMAAQRATKILGIFVRLNERDGKPAYLAHLPRIETYLQRSMMHPALEAYKALLTTVTEP